MSTTELEQLLLEVAERGATFRLTLEGKLLVHPRNRLGKSLLKRIKKRRKDIRAILQAAADLEAEHVTLPVCWECGEIIAHDEPAYELENLETGVKRPAHTREECAKALGGFFAGRVGKGELWALHHVHACGDAESGFACVGGCFRGEVSAV
jgi:hypothetical protein